MIIRNMNPGDLDFAFSLTRAEGWLTETRDSFVSFLDFDPQGTFIGECDGRRVGICVGVAYHDFGFLGELIVAPSFRGRGLGRELFRHTLDFFAGRGIDTVILHGDEPAVPIYEKSGFRKTCRSLNFLGQAEAMSFSAAVQPMTPADMSDVSTLDRRVFGGDRSFFFRRFMTLAPGHCFVEIDENDALVGFICGRIGNGVVAAGPWVVSEASSHAADLLAAFSNSVAPQTMRIDILETQLRAGTILEREFPFLRENGYSWKMIRGQDPYRGIPELALAVGTPATG